MTQQLGAVDSDDRYLPTGEIVADRFKLDKKVGEGPFGQVFRATDTLIDTEVAIKVYSRDLIDDPRQEEQFLKATRSARALTQKNVVRLHDSGIHRDHPWVSMQRLEGLNLRKVTRLRWQRKESFSIPELEPILSQITLALQHVGRDYPHGDLKPENIIFLPELVKVTDSYLLAAIPGPAFAKANRDCFSVAPELRGDDSGEPNARCDVYSVGAIIGYMLFGADYTPGAESDAPGGLSAIDTLCQRAMADVPGERYPSVEALNEDFTAVVDTGSLLETRPSSPPEGPRRPPEPGPDVVGSGAGPEEPTQVVESPVEPASTPAGGETKSGATAASDTQAPEPSDVAASADPLDTKTSPEIGMPLEEDIETAEYDRENPPELGDLLETNEVTREQLETNEVDREQLEATRAAGPSASSGDGASQLDAMGTPPSKQPDGAPEDSDIDAMGIPPSEAETETSGSEKAGVSSRTRSRERPPTPSGASRPEGVGDAEKPDGDDSPGASAMTIGVVAIVAAAIIAIVVVVPEDEEAVEEQQADSTEVVDEVDDEEAADEARLMEKRQEAVAAASELPEAAIEDATDAANARAEALREERQEQQEEQEEQEQQEEEPEDAPQDDAVGAAASPSGAGQPSAPPVECPGAMTQISVGGEDVCIDTYQYPGRGHRPETDVSWFDARRLCDQQDKRLCTIQEWQAACGSGYPYGASFNPERCNTADADGFPRAVTETGDFPECRSHVGAYDMSGNVHEWTEEQRVVGGAYDSDASTSSCDYSSAMSAGSSRDNVGFRCCQSP